MSEKAPSRRILRGSAAGSTRPYMVYLRPAAGPYPAPRDPHWLCGGVILSHRHVLTSAACIEDVKNFYVVSGTHKWVPLNQTNECVKEGAKRAIAKTVPKDYDFDGTDLNNIRWMVNDIAIVKVEDDFNFKKRVKGCHFVPRTIAFNNQSLALEKPRTKATIAGWGSQYHYSESMEMVKQSTKATEVIWQKEINLKAFGVNSPVLLETNVVLMSKSNCKNSWPERYHHIIDDHMICAKDSVSVGLMSKLCESPNCEDPMYSYENENAEKQHSLGEGTAEVVGQAFRRRRAKADPGGFCENDHGGPLVVGRGYRAMVIGVISACQTKDLNRQCHGPFLFTSVYQHRRLIKCVIREDTGDACKRYLVSRKSGTTQFNWSLHPDR